MTPSTPIARPSAVRVLALIAGAVAAAATLALAGGAAPAIVKTAACAGNTTVDCNTQGGLSGFVSAADALISPAIVAMIAVAPLGCLVGAGALMFGNRRGLVIIGAALGTLVFIASLKGIVA